MRGSKLPNIIRNTIDKSITLTYDKPKCSLIWLHGLGDESESFVPFFTNLASPLYQGCRIKLIQAPNRYLTINMSNCNSWYDIRSLNRFTQPEHTVFDYNQVNNSANIIDSHFKDQLSFWSDEDKEQAISGNHRIYVGGFSQGGVMSLHYGLGAAIPPAGTVCFSGYMLKYSPVTNLKKMPILLMHGQRDPVIKQIQARNSYSRLLQDKYLVQYETVRKLDHSLSLQELQFFKKWMNSSHQFIRKHYEKKEEL